MVPQSPMAVDYSQIDSEAEDFDEVEKKPSTRRRTVLRSEPGKPIMMAPGLSRAPPISHAQKNCRAALS